MKYGDNKFEHFLRDGNLAVKAFNDETVKRETREMKINILEEKYMCTDAYSIPKNPMMWEMCTDCGLRPLIWEFDNGRATACGCGTSPYEHHSIHAESVRSVVERCGGSAMEYDLDALMNNWNQWVKTGKGVMLKDLRKEEKW
jgi:hypothetical protein